MVFCVGLHLAPELLAIAVLAQIPDVRRLLVPAHVHIPASMCSFSQVNACVCAKSMELHVRSLQRLRALWKGWPTYLTCVRRILNVASRPWLLNECVCTSRNSVCDPKHAQFHWQFYISCCSETRPGTARCQLRIWPASDPWFVPGYCWLILRFEYRCVMPPSDAGWA